MTNVNQLQIQIVTHLKTLQRELARLSVRQSALLRCRQSVMSENIVDISDDEEEVVADIIANIEAIEYDLITFKDQLQARLTHAERGLHLISLYAAEKNSSLLYQHVLDGVMLCVSDGATARAGYDELIENLKEMSRTRDL